MPDEFDIDLEDLDDDEDDLDAEPEATPAPAAKPALAAAPAAVPGRAPRVMTARKPGQFKQLTDKVKAPLNRIKLPEWNLRTFAQLLGIVLVLWFLLENWPPARVEVLIWNFDAPKTVLFLFNVILGALLLRGWQIFLLQRAARRAELEAAALAAAAEAE